MTTTVCSHSDQVEAVTGDPESAQDDSAAGAKKRGASRLTKANADMSPVTLSILIPKYVRQQLKKRAAGRHMTVTSVILNALAQDGITVYADDLLDDRRRKPK